ncbi:MAG: reverse transcriptase-like protein [bacterium]|nr:reverse transcriptase-like protein [bacterium]
MKEIKGFPIYQILDWLGEGKTYDEITKAYSLTAQDILSAIKYAASSLRPKRVPNLTIYIDGSSCGNPGPSGVGIIIHNGKKVIERLSSYIGKATNNISEYKALILALQYAKRLESESLTIFSDSKLMVNQINGRYMVKNKALKRFYNEAKQLINEFSEFTLRYIPREHNKEANRLANQASLGK